MSQRLEMWIGTRTVGRMDETHGRATDTVTRRSLTFKDKLFLAPETQPHEWRKFVSLHVQ